MIALIAGLLIGVMLVGYVNVMASPPNDLTEMPGTPARNLIAPAFGEQNPGIITAASGANDFAFRLSALLAKDEGGENFVVSPFSVWLPLAALVNATDEINRPALLEALGASGISADDINAAASRMLYDLTNQREKDSFGLNRQFYPEGHEVNDPLKIANAIFVDIGVTIKQSFAQTFMDYYRGSVINADFRSDEAADAVNKWASDNTDGLIDRIIEEFDEDAVAAIANAIYFSDAWAWEFDLNKTTEDVFRSPSGETAAFYMLREGDGLTYYEDELVQAMPLFFANGGGMYVLLPKDGDAVGLLTSMTNDYFGQIQRDSRMASGKLLLPRFTVESGIMPLKDVLESMGVPLFNGETAPLTGGLIEESLRVWVSDAVQKAVIEVDEKGTTAAAVTVMQIVGTSLPMPTEPFEMICDRPFVFILYRHTHDGGSQALFTGIVNRP